MWVSGCADVSEGGRGGGGWGGGGGGGVGVGTGGVVWDGDGWPG